MYRFNRNILLVILLSFFYSIQFAIADNEKEKNYSKILHINLETLPENKISALISELENRLRIYPDDHEAELLKIILYFKSGKLEIASEKIDKLINKAPTFQLAILLKNDLLSASLPDVDELSEKAILALIIPIPDNTKKQLLDAFREQIQVRLNALLNNNKDVWPRQILSLGKSVKKALLIDKTANRLYVFNRLESGELFQEVNDYYITTGKLIGDKTVRGDLRTPEGVYFVTSWIAPEKLPAKYGIGAFPINYPNELDKHNGKTGSGIWLHGLNKDYFSRPPRDSKGCVVLANIDLESLKGEIKPGITPVVITDNVEWIEHLRWQEERNTILQTVENWRVDWESMDMNKYLSHYDAEFWSSSNNFKSWSARKHLISKNKIYQSVKLSDISVLAYPKNVGNDKEIVVVRFYQSYESNNHKGEMYKRLYLTKKDESWKILYEGH